MIDRNSTGIHINTLRSLLTLKEEIRARDHQFRVIIDITVNPKLYVKFAKTDVASNEQTLVIEGFENKADFSKDEVNKDLAAPELSYDNESLTPTSIQLNWTAVDGATSYELKADGVINSVGTETSFLDKNLDYHSAHTYQIRSRNAEGYSEWSNELQVTTLEDPWRNVPEQSIKWEYGDQWGKIAHANDKNFNTMFHSTGDATCLLYTSRRFHGRKNKSN